MGNADGLCQLPVEEAPYVVPLPGDVVLTMETLADTGSPVTVTSIRTATARDCVLFKVREMVLKGWPLGNYKVYNWGRSFNHTSKKLWN